MRKKYYNKKDENGNFILDQFGNKKVFVDEFPLTPTEEQKEIDFMTNNKKNEFKTFKNRCINAFKDLTNRIYIGIETELTQAEIHWYSNLVNYNEEEITKDFNYLLFHKPSDRIEALL